MYEILLLDLIAGAIRFEDEFVGSACRGCSAGFGREACVCVRADLPASFQKNFGSILPFLA